VVLPLPRKPVIRDAGTGGPIAGSGAGRGIKAFLDERLGMKILQGI
jgi:hypothetical protein